MTDVYAAADALFTQFGGRTVTPSLIKEMMAALQCMGLLPGDHLMESMDDISEAVMVSMRSSVPEMPDSILVRECVFPHRFRLYVYEGDSLPDEFVIAAIYVAFFAAAPTGSSLEIVPPPDYGQPDPMSTATARFIAALSDDCAPSGLDPHTAVGFDPQTGRRWMVPVTVEHPVGIDYLSITRSVSSR